ncbi:BlaR1 peptidase M56 [Balneicella halophila]|uniref:BlaR1 peptidase M56 n=1 Tax=Balneicella halophila TaxID=1537566 RepID=A0A7L4URR7_BALHA|nr:M56 family metallopeptidase [Balneicella halophila]PVX52466.1 BlaR1 peptidase M56 [Balneicella halophila]
MIAFIVKTLICSGLLYGLYYFLLRKETFFRLNRIYLLAILLLSALIPLIQITIPIGVSTPESFFYTLVDGTKEFFFVYLLDEVIIYGKASPFSWPNIIEKVYYIGIFVFSIRVFVFLYQITSLHRVSKKYRKDGVRLFVHNKPFTAFSFWNIIYVNKEELNAPDFKVIWKHEIEHIKQGHTIESFLLEVWSCIFWFNPFVWSIKRKLKEIHEYQTDYSLIEQGMDTIVYQQHLLNYTLDGHSFAEASNFAATALKNRIKMLAKSKSPLWRKTKVSLVLPLLLVLVLAFATDYAPLNASETISEPVSPVIDSLSTDSIPVIFE